MKKVISTVVLLSLGAFAASAHATIPASVLYPFPGYDIETLRSKTKAEWIPESSDLKEAWGLYREVQGAWMPRAPKPNGQSIARLDQLKRTLEAITSPEWFVSALAAPKSGHVKLADKIGDPTFLQQKATVEYQALKALAIVYLAEHELDRDGAAQKAGQYLTALVITHPWDWEIHSLNSRLLVDARLPAPAWDEAKQSIFLNPAPSVGDLKFFAFVGSIAAKEKWPDIQEAIREATSDKTLAELAIVDSANGYSADAQVSITEPKR